MVIDALSHRVFSKLCIREDITERALGGERQFLAD